MQIQGWGSACGVPIASFTRLAEANGTGVVAGKAVLKTCGREESRRWLVGTGTYSFFTSRPTTHLSSMSSGRSRSILVTNSQSNTTTHPLQNVRKGGGLGDTYNQDGQYVASERAYWSGNWGRRLAGNHVNSLCRHVGTMRSMNPAASWWIQDLRRTGLAI